MGYYNCPLKSVHWNITTNKKYPCIIHLFARQENSAHWDYICVKYNILEKDEICLLLLFILGIPIEMITKRVAGERGTGFGKETSQLKHI